MSLIHVYVFVMCLLITCHFNIHFNMCGVCHFNMSEVCNFTCVGACQFNMCGICHVWVSHLTCGVCHDRLGYVSCMYVCGALWFVCIYLLYLMSMWVCPLYMCVVCPLSLVSGLNSFEVQIPL